MRNETGIAALEMEADGYHIVPLVEGGKRLRFKNPRPYSRTEIAWHFIRMRLNVGILLTGSGICVADCDDADARELADRWGLVSPMVAITSRGEHRYFRHDIESPRNVIRLMRKKLDILFNGHIVAPPSYNAEKDHVYRWKDGYVRPEELPLFPSQILEKPKPRPVAVFEIADERKHRLASRFLATHRSVAGENGDMQLFRAACYLIQFLKLDDATAFGCLQRWNSDGGCSPPWPEERLHYKIAQARKLMK